MKTIFTICSFVLSLGVLRAQEAGKAGELLKNEARETEMQVKISNPSQNKIKEEARYLNVSKRIKGKRHTPRSNNEYRWNYTYGNAEVFLRIPEEGRFTIEIGDQTISNATGKFRFFELQAGSVPVSIYDDNFLIYRTRLLLRTNTRTVLDFFSDYGLFLLGSFPQQNQANGVNEWDEIWNNSYGNQDGTWSGSGNFGHQEVYSKVMNNQEFSQFLSAVKRDADFDESKIGFISNGAKYAAFKATQIAELLKVLSFDKGKVQLAKQLYLKCIDKQNFYQIYETLNFDSSKRDLNDFVSKN